jgi:hypothetical protein
VTLARVPGSQCVDEQAMNPGCLLPLPVLVHFLPFGHSIPKLLEGFILQGLEELRMSGSVISLHVLEYS